MKKFLIPSFVILSILSCSKNNQLLPKQADKAAFEANQSEKNINPLSEIDLSKIGHIAPKCRVQDKELNQLSVVDDLIANGKNSIPFLINKLEDKTKIDDYVMDFWNEISVGDVAFIILTDFFSGDCDHSRETINGAGWNAFLDCTNPDIPAQNCYVEYIKNHGRKAIKSKWQTIWEQNRENIYWDETERCFKLKSG